MCKRAHKQTETNTVIAPFVDELLSVIVVIEQDALAHLGLLDSHQVVCSWVVVPPRGLEVSLGNNVFCSVLLDLLLSLRRGTQIISSLCFFWECASAFLKTLAVASMKHKR